MSTVLNIALVGAPNSGKTTLYNWLTGSKYKTVNYPGATVEYAVGGLSSNLIERFQLKLNQQIQFIDTPGIYSLNAKTSDEEVTADLLFKQTEIQIDFVYLVLDATQLNRQIPLLYQIQKSNIPFQVIFMMNDLAEKEKIQIRHSELLQELSAQKPLFFDGLFGTGLEQILKTLNDITLKSYQLEKMTFDPTALAEMQSVSDQLYKKYVKLSDQNLKESPLKQTLAIDRWTLHPLFGFIIFFLIMTLLFSSVYWLATPFMDLIDSAVSFLSDSAKSQIPGLAGEFISDGVIAAVGGVIIFIPQIFILFFGLGVLENSGYLSRVATLIDRPLSLIGLGGRSFVPLLSGFACAVPAIMATRHIQSKKQKLIAQFIIPFMTCSARLPVYALMIGLLLPTENNLISGFVLAGLYFFAIFVSALVSAVMSKIIQSSERPMLSLDLPFYRAPRLKIIFRQSYDKSKSFVKRAGPIIFVLAIVLWFATQFPRPENSDQMSTSQITEQSYAGQFGKVIQPLFEPMGLDWRAGFGIISSFAAREVFVSSMLLVFDIPEDAENEDAQLVTLRNSMQQATFQSGPLTGQKIFTFSSCLGILIFFMLALQCLSTYAILKQESGGHKLALAQLIFSNFLAYGLAVFVVQGLRYLFPTL